LQNGSLHRMILVLPFFKNLGSFSRDPLYEDV
jgi:hypothetical protein